MTTDVTHRMIMEAIQKRVEAIAEEEGKAAAERVLQRTKHLAANVAINIYSQMEIVGREITLRVQFPEGLK